MTDKWEKKYVDRCTDSKWIEATRVKCKNCGHTLSFYTRIPYLECANCGTIVFRNKKCEFDFRVKRRVVL